MTTEVTATPAPADTGAGASPNVSAMAEEISGALFASDDDDTLVGGGDDVTLVGGDDTVTGTGEDTLTGGDDKTKVATPAPATAKPAPQTWRPEVQAKWASLAPEVQAEILKREEDMFKGIESYKRDADFGKSIQQVFAPHLKSLSEQGIQPIEHMNALLEVHNILTSGTPGEKHRLASALLQQYGVDLGKPAPQEDAEVARLRREVASLKMNDEAQKQAEVAARRAKVQQEIDTFAADPANAWYAEVEADIPALLRSGTAKNLKEAYEKAVWANPVTRAKEQARLKAESDAKAKAEADAQRKKQEAASAANVKSKAHPGGSGTVATGSIDDTLNETLRSLRNRS